MVTTRNGNGADQVHGYGMAPEGWSPGYCWCGKPGYDGFAGRTGCLALALIFGRLPTSHEEARDLGKANGMVWDGFEDAETWRAKMLDLQRDRLGDKGGDQADDDPR